jgi:dTDP-glucose pyrophosphorylase
MQYKNNSLSVTSNFSIKKCLELINDSGENTLLVVDKKKKLIGTLSDGDIRRAILKNFDLKNNIKKYYHKKPYKIFKELNKSEILDILIKKQISIIPLVDNENKIIKVYSKKNFLNNNIYSNSIIIMAGGKGLRMKPFTNLLPKAMLPFNNSTIIEEIIRKFKKEYFNNFFITTGFKSNILKKYLLSKKYKDIKFSKEKNPLGTIGGIKKIEKEISDVFLLTNCDTLIDLDYKNLIDFHNQNKNFITIVSALYKKKINYGVCRTNKNDDLKTIEEKPDLNFLINTGFYVMNKKILKKIPRDKYFDATDLIKKCIKNKFKIGMYPIDMSKWTDVGNWEDYKKAKDFL